MENLEIMEVKGGEKQRKYDKRKKVKEKRKIQKSHDQKVYIQVLAALALET